MSKRFLVSGGCGFIGSHIVNALIERGDKVVVVDNLYSGYESYLPDSPNLTFLNLDISNWDDLSRNFAYFQGIDCVIHAAAIARIQPSIYNPSLTHKYNVTGTLNVLQIMRMCQIPSIVYSASSSYYGKSKKLPFCESDPPACETPYAITKHMGELYIQTWGKLHGIRNVCLRYFNVYGPRSPISGGSAPIVGKFFRQALLNNPITIIGDGSQSRDFTHVKDVVQANLMAADKLRLPNIGELSGKVFNIGTGTKFTIHQVADMVMNAVSAEYPQNRKPFRYLPERIGETHATLADNSLAKLHLGWTPFVAFEDGVKDLMKYYVENIEDILKGRRDL